MIKTSNLGVYAYREAILSNVVLTTSNLKSLL